MKVLNQIIYELNRDKLNKSDNANYGEKNH